MGRERCLFCDCFILEGDDVTRPAALGLRVHRHCYLRDAGLEPQDHGVEADLENADSDESAA
jgi:hypothetical protein